MFPMNYSQSPDGMLFLRNGIDPVQRWDGFTDQLESAGIPAPATAPTLTGSGTGDIVGAYRGYVRFLDRYGTPSSLSPLSAEEIASSTSIAVEDATFASPIVVTTGSAHGYSTGQLVNISGVLGNTAANGNWTITALSSTTFSLDGSTGNATYQSGGTILTGNNKITYTNVAVPTDPKITTRQILRNKTGVLTTFYVDVETTDLSSTSFESTNTDDDLSEAVPLEDANGNDLAVSRFNVPSPTKAVAIHHLGRMFAAVVRNYTTGCVSVTSGNATVTGIGTNWVSGMAGRYLDVGDASGPIEIASVASATSLTLTEAYTGTTDPFALYAIRPGPDERRELTWSETGFPEAWPSSNSRVLQEDPSAGELTGLMTLRSWLYVLSEYRVSKFSHHIDPRTDSILTISSQLGCVNDRCWVIVGGIAYMLCYVGVHAFAGNSDEIVSGPIQDLFENTPSSKYGINWKASDHFHAIHDPGEGIIRWFVALSGYYSPHHAICHHLERKTWWIEEYPYPVGCSALATGPRPQGYFGTDCKRFGAFGAGTLDGIDKNSGTTGGTVTSSGPNWFADSTATFSSTAVGWPVVITDAYGNQQTRIVSSVSGTKVYVTQPWNVRPRTTATYQLGGIAWKYRSPWFRWQHKDVQVDRAMSIQFKPTTTAASMGMRFYRDLSTTPEDISTTAPASSNNGVGSTEGKPTLQITTTKASGYVQHRMDGYKNWWADGSRFVSAEIDGVQGVDPQRIYRIRIDGVEQ